MQIPPGFPPPPPGFQISDPAYLRPSKEKLVQYEPAVFGAFMPWYIFRPILLLIRRAWKMNDIAQVLAYGDARAAVVLSTQPLCVAAYSDEMDASVVLKFNEKMSAAFPLAPGTRLVTVNNYFEPFGGQCARDIAPGQGFSQSWANFRPFIGDFVSDDAQRLQELKANISEQEWNRCYQSGVEYVIRNGGRCRNGKFTGGAFAAPSEGDGVEALQYYMQGAAPRG